MENNSKLDQKENDNFNKSNLVPSSNIATSSFKCQSHPLEVIERACMSPMCTKQPFLCWHCSVDDPEHCRSHRNDIVRVEQFGKAMEEKYLLLHQQKAKDRETAPKEILSVLQNEQTNIETYKRHSLQEKENINQEFSNLQEKLAQMCHDVCAFFDEQINEQDGLFDKLYADVKDVIEERYGLKRQVTNEEIQQQVESLGYDTEHVTQYVLQLKEGLKVKQDLLRDSTFRNQFNKLQNRLNNKSEFSINKNEMNNRRAEEAIKRINHEIETLKSIFLKQFQSAIGIESLETNVIQLSASSAQQQHHHSSQLMQQQQHCGFQMKPYLNRYEEETGQKMSHHQNQNTIDESPSQTQKDPNLSRRYKRSGENSGNSQSPSPSIARYVSRQTHQNVQVQNVVSQPQHAKEVMLSQSQIRRNQQQKQAQDNLYKSSFSPSKYTLINSGSGSKVRASTSTLSPLNVQSQMHNQHRKIASPLRNSNSINSGANNVALNSNKMVTFSQQQLSLEKQSKLSLVLRNKLQTGHSKSINCMAVISNELLATGSKDKLIKLWRWQQSVSQFKLEGTLTGHTDSVCALCVVQGVGAGNGERAFLASGGGNFESSIIVWDVLNLKQVANMGGHQSSITCIASLDDRTHIISGSYDNSVILWNCQTSSSVFTLKKHTAMISALQLLPTTNRFASASWDKTIAIWQLTYDRNKQLINCSYEQSIVEDYAILTLGMTLLNPNILIYSGTSSSIKAFNLLTNRVEQEIEGSHFGINEICIIEKRQESRNLWKHSSTQDQGYFIVGLSSNDYTLRLWDSANGKELVCIKDQENFVMSNFNTSPKIQCVYDRQGGAQVVVVNFSENNSCLTFWDIVESTITS